MKNKKIRNDFDDVIIETGIENDGNVDIYKYSDIIDRLVAERKKLKKIIEELEYENEELRKQEIKIPKNIFYVLIILFIYFGLSFRSDFIKFEKSLEAIKSDIVKIKTFNLEDFRKKLIKKNDY
jgi:hypothetical protein